MHTVTEAADLCLCETDLPPKNRVWGFREPARSRIRKSGSQVSKLRRENRPTSTTIALGRWFYLQPDPIGLDGGPNLYAYAGNNPVRAIDPRGTLSVLGAFYHYLNGDGRPVQVSFNEIDTSFVKPSQFRGFQQILASIARQTVTVPVDVRQPFSMRGSDALIYGSLTLRLLGLVQSDECKWSFDGCLRSFDDTYDFNAANRSAIAEGLTWFGRQMPGTPYTIEIRGQKPIRESGTW